MFFTGRNLQGARDLSHRYFLVNKPFNMVSQFISSHKVRLLGDLDYDFPEFTHAIGRLDRESEGLLILTTDRAVTRLLYAGDKKHQRVYLVMVKNEVSHEKLRALRKGVLIPVKGGEPYLAEPVAVRIVSEPTSIYRYATDERERYPHTWLLITLTEGKFRQVRKMVSAIHHRCLRLIRISIADLQLGDMEPGTIRELDAKSFYQKSGLHPVQGNMGSAEAPASVSQSVNDKRSPGAG